MNKLTSVHLTFDKVLITILVPGITACFPFIMILFKEYTSLKTFFDDSNISVLIAFCTICALITGLILENIGGRIEVLIYDPIHKKQSYGENYVEIWEQFLTLNYKEKEPVGHRYLRDILMRMKFELSFGVALLIMSSGLLIFDSRYILITDSGTACLVLFILPILLSTYLLVFEGYSSSKILCTTRKLLVGNFQHELGANQGQASK